MTNFNATNSPTQQPWHAYYCDNLAYQNDEDKNQFFLENFLDEQQRDRVLNLILRQDLQCFNSRLTNYRKITHFLLESLPNMAFNVPGWSCPPEYRPLLQGGRAKSRDGRMEHARTFRLHHIFKDGIGFFLTYSKNDNGYTPEFYGLHVGNSRNPLDGIERLERGAFLGGVIVGNDCEITIGNHEHQEITNLMRLFNSDPNNKHSDRFLNHRANSQKPLIPMLQHCSG